MPPRATYRLQLNGDFTFDDAAAAAGYLRDLGVSHVYLSPVFQAAPGSTHGYDVADPQRLSDDLGGAAGYARMVGSLQEHGLSQVLDIVPNHMAADPGSNHWWWDVLENGPASLYASFFDIDWESGDERSAYTVLVPVLGDHYGRVLEAGEIRVARTGGTFVVRYFDHRLPVSPRTVDELLARAARSAGNGELAEIAEGLANLPPARMTDRAAVEERHNDKLDLAAQLAKLCDYDDAVAAAVDAEVEALNADPDRLDHLLRRQNYRLAFWRTASEEIDYRRFFNIETLVGVRVEDATVFEQTHQLILQLVDEGTVDGLRVDHVDGLRDPEGYLRRLSGRAATYIVAEKILALDERLPGAWPIAGTSGYDFLTRVNNLFVERSNEAGISRVYQSFTGETATFDEVANRAKQQIMSEELAAETQHLVELLARVCDRHRRHRDHTRRELSEALRAVVAEFPVYRTYVCAGQPPTEDERQVVGRAVVRAADRRPDLDGELLEFVGRLALGESGQGDPLAAEEAEFLARLQQLTAPVMAKGVEDTAFYRYNRFVSLNEVGGDPGVFGWSPAAYHDATGYDAQRWPDTMLTLSTHDTKRSADVRARLNVLAEIPDEWGRAVEEWASRNEPLRTGRSPDPNAEYLLYQTIVGAWPIGKERLQAYMAKATKEAKVHTSWTDPDLEYDEALSSFVGRSLSNKEFVAAVEHFLDDNRLCERGLRNSLSQTALMLTSPGVPDVYQGTETLDLSLVDPDNRRPVDFGARREALERVTASPEPSFDGRSGDAKTWLVHTLLAHRAEHPDLYRSGVYEPIAIDVGDPAVEAGAIGFCRGDLAVVVATRTAQPGPGSVVAVPAGSWREILGGGRLEGGPHDLHRLVGSFPVVVLQREGR